MLAPANSYWHCCEAIRALPLPPLSAYIHLPWCERKCPYCDFNSHEAQIIPDERYVDVLLEDLRGELENEQRPLETVFIGGGTPSLFSVAAIDRLLGGLREFAELPPNAEITMEANPGSTESGRLAAYARAGVTRFSLGLQSLDDRSLRALGRVHDSHAARSAVQAATDSGAGSFNIDLMHGLPEQTLKMGLADIKGALALAPPHLSWYQLTIEANTHFYSSPPILPLENVLGDLEEQGSALLIDKGYRRYEVSAWALPGQECRHNLNYWMFGDYVAAGAGAHGKLSSADGRILRYAKTRKPDDYMGPRGSRRCALRELDRTDRLGEFMLGALRLEAGFDIELFEERTGLNAAVLEEPLRALEGQGLVARVGDRIATSRLGRRFLDDVTAQFFPD
ncbi:MAG: putative oxygen-independent coproporphyrinogen III oxidase [Halieaceae bacterium]